MNLIEIDVTDEIQPLLDYMAANSKKSIRSAAKSLGYYMQKEIKEGVKSGAPGGSVFVERRPFEVRSRLGSAAKTWYGRMLRAIGYQYDDGLLRIGWTSRTAAMYGRKQEEGYITRVTTAVRERYRQANVPLGKKKTQIKLPARPIFEPMGEELQPQIAPYVQMKLNDYADQSVAFSKKARRKYKVYGG